MSLFLLVFSFVAPYDQSLELIYTWMNVKKSTATLGKSRMNMLATSAILEMCTSWILHWHCDIYVYQIRITTAMLDYQQYHTCVSCIYIYIQCILNTERILGVNAGKYHEASNNLIIWYLLIWIHSPENLTTIKHVLQEGTGFSGYEVPNIPWKILPTMLSYQACRFFNSSFYWRHRWHQQASRSFLPRGPLADRGHFVVDWTTVRRK